jgi:predicted nucleic acid-binding protein
VNSPSTGARYEGLRLGLADCSLVIVAHRRQTTEILSFDERHLRAVAPIGGGTFTLLPADV